MKLDKRFQDTEYTVEANSFEKHTLWQNFSLEALDFKRNKLTPEALAEETKYRVNWKDDSMGSSMQIGEINKRPICVTFFWTKINNRLIMFYECTSQLVDHEMLQNWLKKYCNPQHQGSRSNCDAFNFHNCIHYINDTNKQL